jgi:hypothetical protein
VNATAQLQLAHIRQTWPHLRDMLDTRHHTPWPPAGRMTTYLAAIEATAGELATGRAARDGTGAGEHPAPLRLDIIDTARAIETALLATADQSAIHQPADLPPDERWRYNASWRHGVPWACVWLTGALEWLPAAHVLRVGNIARGAAARLDRALDLDRSEEPLAEPCPHCRGHLLMEGGDGRPAAVRCRDCGRVWRDRSETAA